ncbi:MAG: MotA/TolQ/ExbB proton channel family protein [Methanofollis sp.]|nr:MotA/TolQ/ExbB proton channel family protein [Methanofollis sp.]
MEITSTIMGIMFILSNALLYPVIIALILLVVWVLIVLGQVISEYSGRTRDLARLRDGCRDASLHLQKNERRKAADALKNAGSNPFLEEYIRDLAGFIGDERLSLESEKLLQDYELKIARELDSLKILTRIAPMLGLMGTLIPLGPALMGLSAGNIEALASNLVVAFSTTILGLLVGGIAYAVMLVKRRWYLQDLSDMEYVAGVLS